MGELPDDRRYTKEHEWARKDGDRIVVGITEYAQDQLGDVVFVGLPEPGTEVQAGQPLGEVESTKSVSDIYSPVTGTIAQKNVEVEQSPELVNDDPYGQGWLVAIDAQQDLDELLSAQDYASFIETL
ncbi:MAG: glycine cleavage system protein GcvH [Actinomycetota bacterium]|nr:glycine cleavage system protein GcvH [Actinomycetota bacterium]